MHKLVLCAAAAIVGAASLLAGAVISAAQAPRVVSVSLKKFEFSVKEITVKKGEPVVIEVTSEDRMHGFSLPAFGVRGDVVPGAVTRIAFTPDREGSFEFLCDVFCGDGHADVTGTLVVKE